ncbi:MAG: rhodanese-like domain-containing protein [Chloroflexi bacterium]|nr:rhodanese-like domain-containing protein [Chloroflexota bacterium]
MSNRSSDRVRLILPLLMIGIGVGLILVVAVYWFTRDRQPTTTDFPNVPTASEEQTYPEIPRVSLTDAKQAYDQHTAVFVDVRDAQSYASAHIPGALSIPLSELTNRLSELNKSDWIIPYCT